MILPEFETEIRYTVPVHGFEKQGPFAESVMDYNHVNTVDLYEMSPYYVYSGGDYPLSSFQNLKLPEGKRILLVRDSYSCAVAPFLSLAVGEVITFDLRYNDEKLTDCIERTDPDLVMVLYNPGSLPQRALRSGRAQTARALSYNRHAPY